MHKQDNTTTDPGLQSIIESMYTAASVEPLCEKSHVVKCKHCGGTGKHDDGSKCPKCKGTGELLLGEGGIDPETGERMSPKAKAKAVQWTKDIKAKLAQAQEIGDSKEANKLQRYLDMHGIDEDNNDQYNIGTDADGAELEQGHIVQYDPTGAHQNDPQVSDAQWICLLYTSDAADE